MKSFSAKTFLLLATVLFTSCSGKDKIHVAQHQPLVPVLKQKEYNNVLELKISNPDSTLIIKGFSFDLTGTTDIKDIAKVSIYRLNLKEPFITGKSELLSELSDISSQPELKCTYNLTDTLSRFMLSLKLNEDADIKGKIIAACTGINTNKGRIKPVPPDSASPRRIGVAVRKHTDDGVDTYRIPGLVTSNTGTLLACYDARRESRRDLQGDIDIGISRSTDGGSTWEPMIIALDMGEYGGLLQKHNGVSDASLMVDRVSGDIYVAGLWMHGVLDENGKWIENLSDTSKAWNHQWRAKGSQPGFGVKQTSQFLVAKSVDDGKTWSKPVNLTAMCKKEEWWLWAPAPGNGITMNNGTLVLPTQGRSNTGEPFSNITFSTDRGKTWKTSSPAYTNTTECAVVELDNGSLMLNMRNNRNRNNEGPDNGRAIFVTSDMGATWSEHNTSENALPEPVCMGSLYKHVYEKDGVKRSILLFSNPDTKKGRHHITIKASPDNGETWPAEFTIMLDEGTGNGYSCLTGVDNETVGILYESSQADLVFQKVEIGEIVKMKRDPQTP